MSVPEAAMHKDGRPKARKHKVWATGQLAAAKSKAKPNSMQIAPHKEFGKGIASPDAGHDPGPG